jgi:peptidyl-dipeptidase Dcp
MNTRLVLTAAACLAVVACSEQPAPEVDGTMADVTEAVNTTNALLEEWDTPFGVPPFDRIASEDYLPAIRAAMKEQNREIEAIVLNTEAPTFANTIEALEFSGSSLSRANRIFSAVNGAHSNDVLKETGSTLAPELSAHGDNILLNKGLFERVLAVYEQRESLHLNAEQERLLDETHKQFVRAGADLPDEAQGRLREINSELAELSQDFRNNVLSETNEFELLVTDKADLGDLPASLVALAADEAKRRGHDCECWSFNTQRPSTDPFLQYSPNRELRKQIFDAYAMRGDNDNDADNKAIASRMAQLRVERATLMGYDNHAEFVLSDNMAENPDNVYGFLKQIWEPALRVSKQERADLEEMMKADGVDDRLRGWDWRYYTLRSPPSCLGCNLNNATIYQPGTRTSRSSRLRKRTAATSPSCTWISLPVKANAAAPG